MKKQVSCGFIPHRLDKGATNRRQNSIRRNAMKRFFTFMLALAILLTFAPGAFAADWSLPDGVPMYEPSCVKKINTKSMSSSVI